MSRTSGAGALLIGATICVAIISAGRIPWTPEPEGTALVRLSWRAVLPSEEDCHPPTPEELAGLPQHMRPAEICTGGPIPYRLRFTLDGETLVDEAVTGAGAREDRPMYVLHEVKVEPGKHRIDVEFGPEEGASSGGGGPAGSSLVQEVELGPLDIALVTRDSDGELILR